MTALLWGIVIAAACLLVVVLVALLSVCFDYLVDEPGGRNDSAQE
jgi:hypothetical protein